MPSLHRLPPADEFGNYYFREPRDPHEGIDTDAPAILKVQRPGPHYGSYFVTLGDGTVLWDRQGCPDGDEPGEGYFQVFADPRNARKALQAACNRRARKGRAG